MSVWRRMMLWSESWNISTRLRPRSLAALQAISAVASACASGLSERPIGATPRHTDTSKEPWPARGTMARGGGADLLGDHRAPTSMLELRDERREPVSRNARRQRLRRQRLRHALRDADDHVVADVHAEGFVDDVQPVDVEIEDDVRVGRRPPPSSAVAWRSKACRVMSPVLVSYCAWMMTVDSLRQHFGDARLLQVEILRARRIEQREHAHDPLRGMPHRAGQDLVGRRDVARDLGDVIDHDGALLQLHPRHQVMLRTLQRFGRHRAGRCASGTREMFLSGTHSAASAQPMRSRPVFKISENSSASLDRAD